MKEEQEKNSKTSQNRCDFIKIQQSPRCSKWTLQTMG
jgi:hypothetical protein